MISKSYMAGRICRICFPNGFLSFNQRTHGENKCPFFQEKKIESKSVSTQAKIIHTLYRLRSLMNFLQNSSF